MTRWRIADKRDVRRRFLEDVSGNRNGRITELRWATLTRLTDRRHNELAESLAWESAEFDKLFELVVTALEKRKGDAAGAELLSDQGFKKLQAGRPYEAISLLGRAMERFIKREHRDDLIFCLMGLSEAYHEAGLQAARSCALAATDTAGLAYFREKRNHSPAIPSPATAREDGVAIGRILPARGAWNWRPGLCCSPRLGDQGPERAQNNRQMMEGMLEITVPRRLIKPAEADERHARSVGANLASSIRRPA